MAVLNLVADGGVRNLPRRGSILDADGGREEARQDGGLAERVQTTKAPADEAILVLAEGIDEEVQTGGIVPFDIVLSVDDDVLGHKVIVSNGIGLIVLGRAENTFELRQLAPVVFLCGYAAEAGRSSRRNHHLVMDESRVKVSSCLSTYHVG